MRRAALKKLANFWPPFLGAGIKVKKRDDDLTSIDVKLKMHFWNRNYVGSHFGGSIYAMTDPFYMLILIENLGRDYIVWDKAAKIDFKKPGHGTLTAHFNIPKEEIARIKKQADDNYKTEPKLTVQVKDEEGDVVAEVEKTLYARRKDRQPKP